MRWFPTLVFSHPHSHSASSLSTTPPASSSSTPSTPSSSSSSFVSASETLKSSSSTPSLLDHKKITRSSGWLFGATSKRSTRARKLRPVADLDPVVVVPPLTRTRSSSTFDRSSISSVEPQPLPLPRDADYRFPSPKDPPTTDRPNSSASAAVDVTLTPGFRMRSVFESQEGRKNRENVETRSTSTQGDNNFWTSALARSAPTSPFASPRRNTKNDDFVPYYYVTPKGNQFWSAPEMPMSEPCSSHIPPAFFDFSAFRTDNIPSPTQQHSRSPPGPTSSIIPRRLSLDTSALITRRETTAPHTVHPLPLPPWAGAGAGPSPGPGPVPVPPLPSPSAFSQPKAESMPMKNQWQKGKLIGRGTFGTVYVATNRQTGALCAMKEAEIFVDDPKSAECIKQLEQEIKVLSQLKHPNIVQYYGSEIIEDRFYIYLEYVHPGSMNKYFREHCGAVTESVVRSFTRHILSGLAYLHSKKTIHRDIKGANLLVDSAGVVKLADFGMAKHLSGHVAELSLKGSPYWMAPELMQAVVQKDNSSDLAFAVDIWSLGCTIIEMFTGKPPWSEYEGAAAMFKVMKDTPPIPETLSADGKDFLRLCFIRNPAERPTASILLDHRFMKNLQQSDVLSSTQLYNGTALLDMYSPRQLSDPISILNAHNAKGKLATESGIAVPYSLYS